MRIPTHGRSPTLVLHCLCIPSHFRRRVSPAVRHGGGFKNRSTHTLYLKQKVPHSQLRFHLSAPSSLPHHHYVFHLRSYIRAMPRQRNCNFGSCSLANLYCQLSCGETVQRCQETRNKAQSGEPQPYQCRFGPRSSLR